VAWGGDPTTAASWKVGRSPAFSMLSRVSPCSSCKDALGLLAAPSCTCHERNKNYQMFRVAGTVDSPQIGHPDIGQVRNVAGFRGGGRAVIPAMHDVLI
jgi:hypothetical protein